MKVSKAFVSIASAVTLTISAAAMAFVASAASTKINDPSVVFDQNNIVVSFGAMSDIHIQASASDHDTYFTNALQKLQQITGGSDKLNAVLIAGDLSDSAPLQELPRIKTMLDANLNSDNTEVIPTIGNHDAYFQGAFSNKNSFKDNFGSFSYKNPVPYDTADDITNGNYHTVINGVHFISVTGYDGDQVSANLPWLDDQLQKASQDNPYMPIFVETHVQPVNTVSGSSVEENGSETRWYTTSLHTVLDKYPQVVVFAGHTHYNGHVDTAVWRGAFTAVNTGSTQDATSRDCKLVQVDNNGVVRIRAYSTTDTDPTSQPLKEWVFANMTPAANPPTNDEIKAATLPEADVLDVDFADGTAKDKASGIEAQTLGNAAQLVDNTAVGKKVASFDGNGALGYTFTNSQYDKLKNSTTLECMFYLNEAPASGAVDILGNMQSAGQGFEYTSGHVLQYWLRIGGNYVVCQASDIEPNKWVNAIATYDNNEVKLYINGLVADRKKVTGDITHPSDPSNVYCLGADVSATGSYEYPSKVLISSAKVYSKALTEAEAYLLFTGESNTKLQIPSDAKFVAVKGYDYKIPNVTATDAVVGDSPVSITVLNTNGLNVKIHDGNTFMPGFVGNYTIIFRANGLLQTQVLKVVTPESANATVTLDKTDVSLTEGDSVTLTATIDPADADTIQKWESSDTSVAIVDENGKVTALKEGTAVITATTGAEKTASCTVTVVAASTSTTGTDTTNSTTGSSSNTTVSSTTSTNQSTVTNTTITTTKSNTGSESTTSVKTPDTGDNSPILPCLLIAVSFLAVGILFFGKKKLEESKN